MVKTFDSLDDFLENTYQIKDKNASSIIGYMPDAHVSIDSIYNLIEDIRNKANGKDHYVVLSDIFDKKDALTNMEKVGVQDPEQFHLNYIASKLSSNEEKDVFAYISTIKSQYGGIDEYLELIKKSGYSLSKEQEKLERERYSKNNFKFNSLDLENKISQIIKNNKEEYSEGMLQVQVYNVAYQNSIKSYQADMIKKLIDKVNKENEMLKIGKTNFILGGGNHDDKIGIDMIKQMSNYSKYIHDINDISGTIEVGDNNFQLAGNVYGISHRDEASIYGEEDIKYMYPHMYEEKTVVQDFDPKFRKDISLEDALQSREYLRITNNSSDETKLDYLLVHDEFGDKIGFENRESIYPNLDSLGLIYLLENNVKKDENGFTNVYSGHIHKAGEQWNKNWMMHKKRSYAMSISSNNVEDVDVKNPYSQINYDLKKLKEMTNLEFERMYKLIAKQTPSNNSNYNRNSDSKAA